MVLMFWLTNKKPFYIISTFTKIIQEGNFWSINRVLRFVWEHPHQQASQSETFCRRGLALIKRCANFGQGLDGLLLISCPAVWPFLSILDAERPSPRSCPNSKSCVLFCCKNWANVYWTITQIMTLPLSCIWPHSTFYPHRNPVSLESTNLGCFL